LLRARRWNNIAAMNRGAAMNALLDLAADGATVVTATRRLARIVQEAHDRRQLGAGRRAWVGIDALPADAWLRRLWDEAAGRGTVPALALLSPMQELALWELSAEPTIGALAEGVTTPRADLAALARGAWQALRDSGHDARELVPERGEESRRLRACIEDFRARSKDGEWVDFASLAVLLADGVGRQHARRPGALVLAGFDRVGVAFARLLEALRGAGVRVERWSPPSVTSAPERAVLPTPADEAQSLALWARARLEEDADATVGIVVPDLAGRRSELSRALEEVLAPGLAGQLDALDRPFSISLGAPLAEQAVVSDALAALHTVFGRSRAGEVARWLGSPYLAGAEGERERRGLAAAAVRDAGEAELDLPLVVAIVRRLGAGVPGTLLTALRQAGVHRRAAPGRRSTGGWAELFWHVLGALGWPGDLAVDSAEHQAVEAFGSALESLGSLEAVLGPLPASEALARLVRLCVERPFEPRTDPVRVEVAGVLETAGQSFSHLWLAGFDDQAWPAPARPNPLLPMRLQRRLEIPLSTSALCLAHARTVGERLCASAASVVVSHAAMHGDEPRRASPLFAHLVPTTLRGPTSSPLVRYDLALRLGAVELETLVDQRGPAWIEGERASGGVKVLQDQAACPFRAFARHRLMVRAVDERDIPLDPRTRGSLAHRVLEVLWAELESHSRLLATPPDALHRLVERAVLGVLEDGGRERPGLRGRLRGLEQRRLEDLALEWLALDAARAGFRVVAQEHGTQVRLDGLALSLRADRVDRLEDGGHLVIDYKTGEAKVGQWFGERPDEPQVPVYACWLTEAGGVSLEVAGAAFGMLRSGRVALAGLADRAGLGAGIDEVGARGVRVAGAYASWESLRAAWRETQLGLAAAFVRGDARVDPKRGSETCRYCEVRALCRVDEGAARLVPET
jgi:probable DNA repair protein